MKFLNEIDGADKVKQDSQNRFVTDTEKVTWNGKWDYNEETIKEIKVNKAGDADTVNGKTVESNVPDNAVFTDTVTTVVNNLTSTSTTNALSAAQGKKLQDDKLNKHWASAGDGGRAIIQSNVTTAGHEVGIRLINSTDNTSEQYQAEVVAKRGAGNYADFVLRAGGKDLVELEGSVGVVQVKQELKMNSKKITGLATPTANTDAVTKNYVDGFTKITMGKVQPSSGWWYEEIE